MVDEQPHMMQWFFCRSILLRSPWYAMCFVIMTVIVGCTHNTNLTRSNINHPPNIPLIHAKQVNLHIFHIAGSPLPKDAIQHAVNRYQHNIAGQLNLIFYPPIFSDVSPQSITQYQMQMAISYLMSKVDHPTAPSIFLLFTPDIDDFRSRAQYTTPVVTNTKQNITLRTNYIVFNAKNIKQMARELPFTSLDRTWELVIYHEMCHALGLPYDKSHSTQTGSNHCTNTNCILYNGIDPHSLVATIFNLGPPSDLCRTCRTELNEVIHQKPTPLLEGHIDPPYAQYDRLIAVNRNSPEPYHLRYHEHINHLDWTRALHDIELAYYFTTTPSDIITIHLIQLLTTCPDPALRDPQTALDIALKLCDRSNHEQSYHLELAAAAAAQAGQYDQAIDLQKRANRLSHD
ncbi:hypothetical protein [Poriferisphaera sp. WC338]|uniref:hypothetical protein n=1 Tax=Poriferisphaera sp. WC338 TaxID=3425129 RepID=UPI003D815686